MKQKRRIYGYVLAAILTLVIGGPKAGSAGAADRPEEGELGVSNSPLTGDEFERGARAVLVTTDLCPGGRDGAATTAAGMVMALFGGITPGKVGGAATIGKCEATGIFSGGILQVPPPADGAGPVGINSGVILSSGDIFDVRGGPAGTANTIDFMSTPWGLPGDADLNALKIPGATTDAAGLTFTVTIAPNSPQRFTCAYVFASDEYDEWVGSPFNDIFGIFVDGANIALIPAGCGGPAGVPVSIRNINGGNPFPGAAPPNRLCYRDWPGGVTNDCGPPAAFPCGPPLLEFEPDGATKVLLTTTVLTADPKNPFVHSVKLVIADNYDRIYDSDAFIVCSLQGGACSIDNVDPPIGCTCLNVLDEGECTALGGSFELDVSCDDLEPPCELTGACCQAFGTCAQTTLSVCTAGGGTYQGDGISCGPIGACNIGQDCVETSETCCNGAGGTYVGDGTFCPGVGACCFGDGTCTNELASDCANQSGDYQGDGTFCFGDNNGNGIDDACEPRDIPAVTEWGMIVMVLLALTAGTVVFARWRRQTAA